MNEVRAAQRSSVLRRVVRKVVVLTMIGIAALITLSMTASRPPGLGLQGDKLAPVPDSPNCVSSMTEKTAAAIEPFAVSRMEDPLEKLKEAISSTIPRARLITEKDNYLHYEFTSRLFRFVDDGEFLLDPDNEVIHLRSASRVGYSDMGANRKRMEKIRIALSSQGQ